jgi:hypothetical protein
MPKYKIDKKEAVEGIIEENLFSQPFMVEMFGTDIEYELDHDTSADTDEGRNPILKQHILVEIEASKQTVELVESTFSDFEIAVKKWLKEYDLDSYFDAIYTSEDDVTISIDVPDQDDSWSPEKYAAKGLEVDGSYIPRVILGAIDRLKNAQDLPAGVMQEMVDKVVDEIRGAGETNLNESYVFMDFLEKLSDEVRKSIKGETIDYLKSHPSDNIGLGNTLSVIDTTIIQYSEDKIYAEYEHKMKVMKTLLDARAKAIKKEVHDAIDAGNKSPISYVITSAIRPKPSRAEDGKDLGKTTVSFYKWGVYQGEEEIDAKDLTHMVQLGQYELEGFDIRDEDIDKTFYAEESDIDDTNVDEDGYGVKRAYAIEEDKAKNGGMAKNGKDTKELFNEAKKRFPKTIEKMVDDNNKNVSGGKDGYPEYKANFENTLFKKYGVMIGDTDIEDSSIKEAFGKNEDVDNLVNYLGKKHQLTPVAAQGTAVEIKSPDKSKSATAKSYICIIKDRFGKEIGSYEVDYADDDYVDTFLSAIGVRLKAGDTKEIIEV